MYKVIFMLFAWSADTEKCGKYEIGDKLPLMYRVIFRSFS